MKKTTWCIASILVLALLPVAAAAAGPSQQLASVRVSPTAMDWQIELAAAVDLVTLRVSGPNGSVFTKEFRGVAPTLSVFDAAGQTLADGVYNWEMTASPRIRPAAAAARRGADVGGLAPSVGNAGRTQSGSFMIAGGTFVDPSASEGSGPHHSAIAPLRNITAADQVIPDDLIVQGSTCVGLDCVNNENFGFDTIRLKENNLRIHFDDTSTQAGFPANDWRLVANDSASGGSSKFSIEDSTGAKTPFTVTAGAATNSIFVDSTGRVGLRSSTPVLDLHINTSNTPAIRLEQNNSGGFTAQTWDIGANEANFFVRDVTGGSKLSFRIRPGAPTSSVDISSDGDVGIGTGSPDTKLHVLGSDVDVADTKLLVENTNGTATARELAEIRNNGDVFLIFNSTNNAARWSNGLLGNTFVILDQADPQIEFQLSPNGNLLIGGTLSQNSSRALKDSYGQLNPRATLEKVAAMPIETWTYKTDDTRSRHVGPMSEDFHAAFGLGTDDKTVSVTDTSGVALAAIQGLYDVVKEKDARIAELQQFNADLSARLQALEVAVKALGAVPQP